MAVLAGVLAVLLAGLTLPVFLRAAPPGIPRLDEVGLERHHVSDHRSPRSLLSALACGAIPALRASAPDLKRLREGGRGSTGRRHWGRDGLVVGQTALALVLLIGSGLLVRSFQALRHVDPGYDTKDIFTFQFAPDQPRLTDGPTWARFHLDFLDRLRGAPRGDVGGPGGERPAQRRHPDRAVPQRRDLPTRTAARCSTTPGRPVTTSRRWASRAAAAARSPRTNS